MTLRVSGKSISIGEALRDRVSERTDEVLRKYFDGNYSGHITLSKDGFGFRTDCALHLDSGITLEADSMAADAYASADQALLLIEKRLRRYKSRLKDRPRASLCSDRRVVRSQWCGPGCAQLRDRGAIA